jgi:hypothetical protein
MHAGRAGSVPDSLSTQQDMRLIIEHHNITFFSRIVVFAQGSTIVMRMGTERTVNQLEVMAGFVRPSRMFSSACLDMYLVDMDGVQ